MTARTGLRRWNRRSRLSSADQTDEIHQMALLRTNVIDAA
jgi:hypothetical protein